jgi:hypothetical protein
LRQGEKKSTTYGNAGSIFSNHLDPHIFKLPWMYFFFLHVLGLPFHVIESELLEPPYGRKFQELFGVHEVHRNFVKKNDFL